MASNTVASTIYFSNSKSQIESGTPLAVKVSLNFFLSSLMFWKSFNFFSLYLINPLQESMDAKPVVKVNQATLGARVGQTSAYPR